MQYTLRSSSELQYEDPEITLSIMIRQKSQKFIIQLMSTAVIIDDYEDIAEVLEQYLKLLGIDTVAKGKNGMEAFELYRVYEPDFIYLDVSMPIFDGFFAIEQIQKKYPAARIIMTTADDSNQTRQRLNHFGITEILYKPFDLQMLKTTLEKTRFHQINFGIAQ